ncbi:MAG TPA: DNA polymerase IV [Actinocrinis sp.]|nr:DNA polymerase IV [Actinocrinis sp.]
MTTSILHVDMDAFYASVEQAHKPSLRGKPVVVGGVGLRGVVSTCSYEARVFGVRSAMPTAQARRLCPNAAYLYPRFGAYHKVSIVVMELLHELSPLVEPVSLDEAFVDLAAGPDGAPATPEQAQEVGRRLCRRILEATGLTGSVGIGTSKLIAKVASDARKPAGVVVVPEGSEQEWLDPLPVRALWGVGPATADRLRRVGVGTVADLRVLTRTDLTGLLGVSWGGSLYQLARGIDSRRVEVERPAKSVSAEDTYPHDLIDQAETRAAVGRLVERVVVRLRSADLTGRTVSVKARGHDFTTVTRAETFAAPTDDVRLIRAAALRLLGGAIEAATATSSGIRLLGVAVTGLADFSQGDLMAELDPDGLAGDSDGDGADGEGGPGPDQLDLLADEQTLLSSASPGDAPSEDPAYAQALADAGGPASVLGEVPAMTLYGPVPVDLAARRWPPGLDVRHAEYGPGWVQGAGVGRVTVRFEGPNTAVGRVRTFSVSDPDLAQVDSAEIAAEALAGRGGP